MYTMRKTVLVFLLSFIGLSLAAQTYTPIDKGSSVNFSIKNLGISVIGKFSGIAGTIFFNPNDLSVSSFSVSVNAGTIDTDIKARDNHLKKEDYFHIEKYPRIGFISKKIELVSAGQYKISGILEIKGIKKEIDFLFTTIPATEGIVFKGVFKINRRDFKVGGKSLILSDNLTVNLSVLAQKN